MSTRHTAPVVERVQWWLAVTAVVMLPWLISPGATEPDTKIDLTVSPWRYLGRALDAWNNHAGLGELQNQAYGYLFPMGPVFGICHSLGIAPWAAQRVWWTLLLVVAFTGTHRLIRRLGVADGAPALVAAAAYALSPRVLTVLPVISIEAWPLALAPWLVVAVIPLVDRTAPRPVVWRSLALAGVLAATLGGVNATASGIVLALPLLFLITHRVGRRRALPWLVAVVAGAAWWLLPLLVLGRYAYPFLNYIETASITTAVTSVPNDLRGASDWIAYILDSANHPTWQGGWVIAQSVTAIIATSAVAALGAWGLLRWRGHLARWCMASVVGATVFMAIGHAGIVSGPFAGDARALLNGALAPLRNVHKADPMIRLPLVIGLAGLLQHFARSAKVRHRYLPAALALLVAVAMTPIWQGRVGAQGAYTGIPKQWSQVATAVDAAALTDGGSTMLLPNSRTATYTWGSPTDEPLSALATSPIVTREAAPLGIPASTRILDVADELAASGAPQPSLAAGLVRLGITRIVLRRDLASAVQAEPWQLVQKTLAASPGFRAVQTFGSGTSALTVYDVTAPGAPTATTDDVTAYAGSSPLTVAGGPEAIFDLYAAGLVSAQQWLQLDNSTTGSADIVTDTMRWRAYNNGVPTALGYSPTLPADDTEPDHIGARDLPPATDVAEQPTRRLIGLSALTASSSGADPFAKAYVSPATSVYAAVDGDPATSWLTGDHERVATLTADLEPTVAVTSVRLVLAGPAQGAELPATVEVTVGGVRRQIAVDGRRDVTVQFPRTLAGTVRVQLTAPSGGADPVLGITELQIPGATLGSVISLPHPINPARQALLITRDPLERSVDTRAGEDGPDLVRQVDYTAAGTMPVKVWVRPVPGSALQSLLAHSGSAVSLGCGQAGQVRVGGATIDLRLTATRSDVVAGGLLAATPCGTGLSVPAGATTVTATSTPAVQPDLVLLGHPTVAAGSTRSVRVLTDAPGHRVVDVAAGAAGVIALDEGFNAGWQASDASGHHLQPVEVDGWRQGFRLTGTSAQHVTIDFTPTTPQRLGLLVGAVLAALLLAVLCACAVVCRRRGLTARVEQAQLDDSGPVLTPRRITAAVLSVIVATLVCGPAGIVVGLVVVAVPRRWLRHTALAGLVLAGVALAFLGVVDQRSAGAVAGQLLGTVTLCALARGGVEASDAPGAGSAVPRAPTTPRR